jgi:hypothetical protein
MTCGICTRVIGTTPSTPTESAPVWSSTTNAIQLRGSGLTGGLAKRQACGGSHSRFCTAEKAAETATNIITVESAPGFTSGGH